MNAGHRATQVVVLASLAILLVLFVNRDDTESTNDSFPAQEDQREGSSRQADPKTTKQGLQRRTGQKIIPRALPPIETPLALSIDALKAAAAEGDPVASCRLALEGSFCGSRTEPAPDLEGLAAAVPELEQGVVSTLSAVGVNDAKRNEHCAGSGSIKPEEAQTHLRNAAELGDVRMRVLYALFRDGQIARLHVPQGIHEGAPAEPVLQHYADNALNYLEEGLQYYDVLALEGMILVHAPAPLQRPMDLPIKQPDPRRFLALLQIYRSLMPGVLIPYDVSRIEKALMGSLGAEELETIDREVEASLPAWRAQVVRNSDAEDLGVREASRLCEDGTPL